MLIKFAKKLLNDKRGGLAIPTVLFLSPLILINVATTQITTYMTAQTRLHQSQGAAVIALAKEGYDASDAAQELLLDGWMNNSGNMQALDSFETSVLSSQLLPSPVDEESIESAYLMQPVVVELFNGIFDEPLISNMSVDAERYYKPIEVVLALDASTSMMGHYETALMQDLAAKVADSLFRGQESTDDAWLSMLAFGPVVNIGWEYRDKLVIPESRKLMYKADDLSEVPRSASVHRYFYAQDMQNKYKTLSAMIESNYGALYVNDVLAEGAPGQSINALCVHRPPLPGAAQYSPASESAIADYVDNIFKPPLTPADGFELVQGDNRAVLGRNILVWPYRGTMMATHAVFVFLYSLVGGSNRDLYSFVGRDVTEMAFIDNSNIVQNERYDPFEYLLWGQDEGTTLKEGMTPTTKLWAKYKDESFTVPGGCPGLPMLVGSTSRREITERIKLWRAGGGTGADEGLSWAARILSPAWRDIWEKGDNFPAEYNSGTTKRIVIMGADTNNGYSGFSWFGYSDTNTPLCNRLQTDFGIEIYVLHAESLSTRAEAFWKNCVPESSRYQTTMESLPGLAAKVVRRNHRVRLI